MQNKISLPPVVQSAAVNLLREYYPGLIAERLHCVLTEYGNPDARQPCKRN